MSNTTQLTTAQVSTKLVALINLIKGNPQLSPIREMVNGKSVEIFLTVGRIRRVNARVNGSPVPLGKLIEILNP